MGKLAQNREEMVLSLINRKTMQAKTKDGGCTYSHEHNGGCAIGCQVMAKTANKLNRLGNGFIWNNSVFYALPQRMQKMGQEFLRDVQKVHDNNGHWRKEPDADGNVWNSFGKQGIRDLITKYELEIDY